MNGLTKRFYSIVKKNLKLWKDVNTVLAEGKLKEYLSSR